jgi:hypothetical protein
LKSEGVAHKTKNMVGFTVGGTSAQIDNLKIWDAMANAGSAGNRAEVITGMKKN